MAAGIMGKMWGMARESVQKDAEKRTKAEAEARAKLLQTETLTQKQRREADEKTALERSVRNPFSGLMGRK